MISAGIYGLDLADMTTRAFNISLLQIDDDYSTGFSSTERIPLVACTKEHMNFSSTILEQYTEFAMETWLCPPLGHTLNLQGKYSSSIFRRLSLNVEYCDPFIDANCLDATNITDLMNSNGPFEL